MRTYSYNGTVMLFDKCIDRSWKAETYAGSEAKARSNLVYRYKREHNVAGKVTLPDKLIVID